MNFEKRLSYCLTKQSVAVSNLERYSFNVLINGRLVYVSGFICNLLIVIVLGSSWTAVIVTYQRYVAVSRPLHARQYITTSRARVAVIAVWIGSFKIIPLLNYACYHDFVHFYLYKILSVSIFYLLPMSLTVFLSIRLIVVVRRSRTFVGQQLSSGGNNDSRNASSNRVTVTLIVILIVYLVCQLPMATVQVLFVIHERFCAFLYDVIAWEICFILHTSYFMLHTSPRQLANFRHL
jgi:hypothetical protein